jgi:hypothetical protein
MNLNLPLSILSKLKDFGIGMAKDTVQSVKNAPLGTMVSGITQSIKQKSMTPFAQVPSNIYNKSIKGQSLSPGSAVNTAMNFMPQGRIFNAGGLNTSFKKFSEASEPLFKVEKLGAYEVDKIVNKLHELVKEYPGMSKSILEIIDNLTTKKGSVFETAKSLAESMLGKKLQGEVTQTVKAHERAGTMGVKQYTRIKK